MYEVTLAWPRAWPSCTCMAFRFGRRPCKHIVEACPVCADRLRRRPGATQAPSSAPLHSPASSGILGRVEQPQGPPLEGQALQDAIRRARWHRSRAWLDVHEYIVAKEEPELYRGIQARLKGPDTWTASYGGELSSEWMGYAVPGTRTTKGAQRSRFKYVQIGAWKYWLTFYHVAMANRAPMPPDPLEVDCETWPVEDTQELMGRAAYRLSERTGTVWGILHCEVCGKWHAYEVPPD